MTNYIEHTKSFAGFYHPLKIEKKLDSFKRFFELEYGSTSNVSFAPDMDKEMYGVKYKEETNKGETTITVKFKPTENAN